MAHPGFNPVATPKPEAHPLVGKTIPNIEVDQNDTKSTGKKVKLHELSDEVFLLIIQSGLSTALEAKDIPKCIHPKWMETEGAAGCGGEAAAANTALAELAKHGCTKVFGYSHKPNAQQQEAASDKKLEYPLLSDPNFVLAKALGLETQLPKDETNEKFRFHKRIALLVGADKKIIAAFPGRNNAADNAKTASMVLSHLIAHPVLKQQTAAAPAANSVGGPTSASTHALGLSMSALATHLTMEPQPNAGAAPAALINSK